MTLTKKTRTYALIGTSTGLVLGCASLATGISLFFVNTEIDKKLKIYLIIFGSIFIIAFIAPVITISLMKVPSIFMQHIKLSDYNSTSNSNNCLIFILNTDEPQPITSFTITAKYISGTNTNNEDINKTIINKNNTLFNIELNMSLPFNNKYDISVIASNSLGDSFPVTKTITNNNQETIYIK